MLFCAIRSFAWLTARSCSIVHGFVSIAMPVVSRAGLSVSVASFTHLIVRALAQIALGLVRAVLQVAVRRLHHDWDLHKPQHPTYSFLKCCCTLPT